MRRLLIIAALLAGPGPALVLFACKTDNREEDEPYGAGYTAEDVTTIAQSEGYPDIRFPVNQLIVYGEAAVSVDTLAAVPESVDGVQVVGQVPSPGLFQLEVQVGSLQELDEDDMHGSNVAGIICADNDGAGMNGLATTLLGDDYVHVGMARPQTVDFMGYCVTMTGLVVEGGASLSPLEIRDMLLNATDNTDRTEPGGGVQLKFLLCPGRSFVGKISIYELGRLCAGP